jgi:hypothetical protein
VSKPGEVLGAFVFGRGVAKAQKHTNTHSKLNAVERKVKVILMRFMRYYYAKLIFNF